MYLEALLIHGQALAQGLHPVWEHGQQLLCVAMSQPQHSLQGCSQPVTQCVSAVEKTILHVLAVFFVLRSQVLYRADQGVSAVCIPPFVFYHVCS